MTSEYSTLLQEFIFISNGSFGMIYYWLMTDKNESVEELAKHISSFIETFLQARNIKKDSKNTF